VVLFIVIIMGALSFTGASSDQNSRMEEQENDEQGGEGSLLRGHIESNNTKCGSKTKT
jgi:hypothetical protein